MAHTHGSSIYSKKNHKKTINNTKININKKIATMTTMICTLFCCCCCQKYCEWRRSRWFFFYIFMPSRRWWWWWSRKFFSFFFTLKKTQSKKNCSYDDLVFFSRESNTQYFKVLQWFFFDYINDNEIIQSYIVHILLWELN